MDLLLYIIKNIFIFLGVFLIISLALTGISIAPWVPVSRRDLRRINELAALKPGQRFVELGSGDARVARYIAKNNPDVAVVGVELSVPVYWWSRFIGFFDRRKNLELRFGNAFKEDLGSYDVVYTFGAAKSINGGLKEKFEKELRKGAKVLSYVFKINDWHGRSFTDKPNDQTLAIHIYEK